ncbi:branched-chain amino acid transport system II carrier protein [Rodentibacter caecimuris]|uniref:Branched-chain amino acid transport system carrier protein n=1 Tax=Rodentibacter caecimuris TaxID=1796644 RepID=A0ABX3KYH4_9PAST|nr:branched-chain amino acid transport system II carrier protein [Rodentibacter heylii]
MNKNILIIGFMLFAIFFGAGNLVFPPKLGFESGADFWISISGFILTGVGLPLLAIIVASSYEGGYKKALATIHPAISVLLLSAIYLTIGPFFAIPRTGATAYDLAIVPFLGGIDNTSLFIFSLVYFGITLWLSLNPTKMVDRIGAILTPALLISILALIIKSVYLFADQDYVSTASAGSFPFVSGMLEGYQTMDALAAFAFSVIVINAVKAKSSDETQLMRKTVSASVVASVALGSIYVAIGWIGNSVPLSSETLAEVSNNGQHLGTFILNTVTTQAFGELGRMILGIIVTLACLTTSIGLVVATSSYFNSIYPMLSYRTYVVIFTLIGFGLANQGLNAVIAKSIPVLLVLYPIAMTALLVLAINLIFPLPKLSQALAIILVCIVAVLSAYGVEAMNNLPLKDYSMEWILFGVLGIVLGFFGKKMQN